MRTLLCLLAVVVLMVSCTNKKSEEMEKIRNEEMSFKTFADSLQDVIAPAYKEMAISYWDASISGAKEDYEKSANAEMFLNKILSDTKAYNSLSGFVERNLVKDTTLSRLLDVLYHEYKAKQLDEELLNKMTKMQNGIEQKYSNYRARVGDKTYSDNDVEDMLKNETDSKKLETIWKAHKEIGPLVAEDIIALVKVRNEAAQKLGYKNYHQMSLTLSELDPEWLEKFFDELDEMTGETFAGLKKEIDEKLSARFGIEPEEMMPWHYQNRYFQEAPKIYDGDLDEYYKGRKLENLTNYYYASIGMEISDMLTKSDLYEKEGKNQHAYCIDIDRDEPDVRVLCNIKENSSWMETMLHEYGHAVYQKYVGKDLPWALKTPTHIFTTEGVAMLFGRFATNGDWMKDMGVVSAEDADMAGELGWKMLRLQQLVFSRWVQVMYRFEKGMYENPDRDLNKLWWDLVEKYQMLRKPEGRNMPDWATKIHIASSPCYYHNYLLGEIWASQFYSYIAENIVNNTRTSFYNNNEAGKFLVEKVFAVANLYKWDEMIKRATGESLTPKYYAKQFVK